MIKPNNEALLIYGLVFLVSCVVGAVTAIKTWSSNPMYFVVWASCHSAFMILFPILDAIYGDEY